MLNTLEKRQAMDAFVKSMCAAAKHVFDAQEGLEIGIPSKPALELCCKEFRHTMWLYNQLMDMDDVPEFPISSVIECRPPVHEFGILEP